MLGISRPSKIILIVIDCLRADHLGCYGYPRETSPNIDSLARGSILFKWAFSACPYTVPSHASMFTGKYPSHHSFGFSNGWPITYPSEQVTALAMKITLPELLVNSPDDQILVNFIRQKIDVDRQPTREVPPAPISVDPICPVLPRSLRLQR